MTWLTIKLPEEQKAALAAKAQAKGLSTEEYVVKAAQAAMPRHQTRRGTSADLGSAQPVWGVVRDSRLAGESVVRRSSLKVLEHDLVPEWLQKSWETSKDAGFDQQCGCSADHVLQ